MTELIPHELLSKEKASTEVSQEKEQEYQLVYQGTIIPHDGHVLYELNLSTNEIKEAKYLKQDYVFNPEWSPSKKAKIDSKVIMNKGCIYISALNKINALKKFEKRSNGTRIDKTKIYVEL